MRQLPTRILAVALFVSAAMLPLAAHAAAASSAGAGGEKPKSARATARYPQAVLVGSLAGRRLLEPEESQHVLGRVRGVVRNGDGANQLVIETGGRLAWLGIGTRLVAVAADDSALLGEYVVLVDVEPDDFHTLPTFRPGSLPPVSPRDTIRMGVVKPFH